MGLMALVCLTACTAPRPAPRESQVATKPYTLPSGASWQKLDSVAFRGKQDDVFFLNPNTGWYVNGDGKIYKTLDGGKAWTLKLTKPGTFFRTIAFVDDKVGFAGNIGTEYFPGVTDTTPLYGTTDGGDTWAPVVSIEGITAKGLCAIDVLHTTFINSGVLDKRTMIHAGGRVGGPAHLLKSLDGGKTWRAKDLSALTAAILDVKFLDEKVGFIMGSSNSNTALSNARVLKTVDGGDTWKVVYQSTRPFEITWKGSFPTREVGYVTVQSYNPDKAMSQRFVAKTTDGGDTWREVPLVDDHAERQFGVAFASAQAGWVGTLKGGYQTTDGGATWTFVDMGRAVNKIRVVPDGERGFVGYAIGVDVRKFDARP
jgi:photosystem II stability/assembly factor-like uncharacterized protein